MIGLFFLPSQWTWTSNLSPSWRWISSHCIKVYTSCAKPEQTHKNKCAHLDMEQCRVAQKQETTGNMIKRPALHGAPFGSHVKEHQHKSTRPVSRCCSCTKKFERPIYLLCHRHLLLNKLNRLCTSLSLSCLSGSLSPCTLNKEHTMFYGDAVTTWGGVLM